MNSYWDKVLHRLISPGMLLVVMGGLVGFLAPKLVEKLSGKKLGDKARLGIKAAGCLLVIAGTLIVVATR